MAETLYPWAWVTLPWLKYELGIDATDTTQDDRVTILGNAAIDAIESYCNRNIGARDYDVRRVGGMPYGFSGMGLATPDVNRVWDRVETPITDVERIELDGIPLTFFLADENPELDPFLYDCHVLPRGVGLWRSFGWRAWTMRLIYSAGYTPDVVPQDLRLATAITAREWYRLPLLQRQGIRNETMNGQSITYRDATMPPEATEILSGYAKVGF